MPGVNSNLYLGSQNKIFNLAFLPEFHLQVSYHVNFPILCSYSFIELHYHFERLSNPLSEKFTLTFDFSGYQTSRLNALHPKSFYHMSHPLMFHGPKRCLFLSLLSDTNSITRGRQYCVK